MKRKEMNKTMIYIALITLLVVAGVLFWKYREYVKLQAKLMAFQNVNFALDQEAKERKVKIEVMLRELNEVYKTKKYQKATFLLGIIDTLEWANGDRKDDQFIGWVLTQKQINKKSKPLKMTEIERGQHELSK